MPASPVALAERQCAAMTCPRCGHEQQALVQCESCGVLFARLGAGRPKRAAALRKSDKASFGSKLASAMLAGILVLVSPIIYREVTSRLAQSKPTVATNPRVAGDQAALEADKVDADTTAASSDVPIDDQQESKVSRDGSPPEDDSPQHKTLSTASTVAYVRDLQRRLDARPERIDLRLQLAAAQTTLAEHYLRERRPSLALAALRQALDHDSTNTRTRLLVAATQLQLGNPYLARRALEQVDPAARNHADYHVLSADIYYADERPGSALKALLKAQELAPIDEDVEARIVRLRREIAGGSDAEVESPHFKMVFTGRTNKALAQDLAAHLEGVYVELTQELPVPDLRVTAVLYSDEDHRHLTDAPDWAAGSFDGKLRIPILGMKAVDYKIRRTLAHELAHALIHARGGHRVPRWLHEGLAQRLAGQRFDALPLSSEERERMARAPTDDDPRLFEARSLWKVEYFYERYGRAKMLALLDEMTPYDEFTQALRRTVQLDAESFESEFRKWASR